MLSQSYLLLPRNDQQTVTHLVIIYYFKRGWKVKMLQELQIFFLLIFIMKMLERFENNNNKIVDGQSLASFYYGTGQS